MSSKAPIPHYSIKQRINLLKIGICKWIIPTYTTGDELFQLYYLARSLPQKAVCVEIGSYIGASSLIIGKALTKRSTLYCVDTWENDAMTEGNWDTFKVFTKNTKSVKNRIIPIKLNSVNAAQNFNNEIDFLFIDGDHSYEGVKADVDAWFKKLKSNGIIVMHDISWAEGVIKVIEDDIKPNLERYEQLPNMFWGWKRG